MKVAIIGAGYVGLVTAAVFADFGNRVWAVDVDKKKTEQLKRGKSPFWEPQVEALVQKNLKAGRLQFTTSYQKAIPNSEAIFICVGTPSLKNGSYNLDYVFQATESIAQNLKKYALIVIKSTVPPGTNDKVKKIIEKYTNIPFDLASCPEFLREGSAIEDTLHPERIIIGAENKKAADLLLKLHQPIKTPKFVCDVKSAQLIKYAANAFLATKISFINLIARLCDKTGADIKMVAKGLGLDPRIGKKFLQAGLGYGGSCFSSDSTIFVLEKNRLKVTSFKEFFEQAQRKEKRNNLEIAYHSDSCLLGIDLETKKIKFSPLICLTKRNFSGTMIEVKTRMGKSLRLTADHPLIIWNQHQNKFKTKLAANLKKGDLLITCLKLPKLMVGPELNLISSMEKNEYSQKVLVRPIESYLYFQKEYDEKIKPFVESTYLKHPHDIKRKNYLPFDFYLHLKSKDLISPDENKLRLFNTTTYCPAVFPINRDFVRLLGYYLAEGWISEDYGRHHSLRKRIGFSFGVHEKEYISDVKRILDNLGIKYFNKISGKSYSIVISSKPLAFLLERVLRCGVDSYDKALPSFIFACQSELKKEMLRGFFSGDGYLGLVFNKYPCFEFATVSRKLAEGVILLLQSLGIVPSLKIQWMNKSTREAFIIRVSKKRQIDVLRDVFGEKKARLIRKMLAGYERDIASPAWKSVGNFAILPIMKVRKEKAENVEVYSGETQEHTLITSFGLLAHNCFPKDTWALISFAQKMGVDFDFLKTVDEVNRSQVDYFVDKVLEVCGGRVKGKTMAVLGLSFKPNTDDMREARSVLVIEKLQSLGAKIKAYDPIAIPQAKKILKKVKYTQDAYEAAKGSNALLIVTEWNEFKKLNLAKIKNLMKSAVIVDGRNLYDPKKIKKLGFIYRGIGQT